jgi:hypothetical protein
MASAVDVCRGRQGRLVLPAPLRRSLGLEVLLTVVENHAGGVPEVDSTGAQGLMSDGPAPRRDEPSKSYALFCCPFLRQSLHHQVLCCLPPGLWLSWIWLAICYSEVPKQSAISLMNCRTASTPR